MRDNHSAAEKNKGDQRDQSSEMYEVWQMLCYLPIL